MKTENNTDVPRKYGITSFKDSQYFSVIEKESKVNKSTTDLTPTRRDRRERS